VPQLLLLLLKSTQAPLQQVSPPVHPAPPPQVQDPLTQDSPAPQVFQQVPQ
jgi:hypothetical protein